MDFARVITPLTQSLIPCPNFVTVTSLQLEAELLISENLAKSLGEELSVTQKKASCMRKWPPSPLPPNLQQLVRNYE